jgi:PPK2 family polyphosphate:nucleotide phosphotransferase
MTNGDLTDFSHLHVKPGSKVRLDEWDTRWIESNHPERDATKEDAKQIVRKHVQSIAESQELLWADNRYALLLVFQGMDAAGKDSTIEHVTSGINPAGVHVVSFKEPSSEDLDHNFLWRYWKALPEHGRIGVFNRSYYEEVVVVRVNPDVLAQRTLPDYTVNEKFWARRFEDINAFERHLVRNGTIVVKFFLHVSKDEQRERLLARVNEKDKHWKFSMNDLRTRERWDEYRFVFEEMLTHTSTEWAPWWVIPADQKWMMRALVVQIVCDSVQALGLRFPPLDDAKRAELDRARKLLEKE